MALSFGYLAVAAHRVFPAAPMCYRHSAVGAIVETPTVGAFSPAKDTLPVSRKTEQIARGFFGGGSLGLFNLLSEPSPATLRPTIPANQNASGGSGPSSKVNECKRLVTAIDFRRVTQEEFRPRECASI